MSEYMGKSNTNYIIIRFIVGLVLASFTLKTLNPNPVIWLTATLSLFLYSYITFIRNKDFFYFLLFIFFASHFSIGQNQGGIFNLLLFAGTLLKLIGGDVSFIRQIRKTPNFLNLLILILVASQLVSSSLNNTGSISQQLFGNISFISCIIIFYYSIELVKSEYMLILTKIIIYLAIFNFIVAINQRFFGIFINSPILPLVVQEKGYLSNASSGTIGSSALFGEYYVIVLGFLLSVRNLTIYNRYINSWLLSFGIFAAFFNVILSNSRSAVLLLASIIGALTLITLIRKKQLSPLIKISVSIFAIAFIGSYFGIFDVISEKLQLIDFAKLSIKGVSTGEDINRGIVFENGIKRLSQNSWIFGNGYGVFETNAEAWFGEFGFSFYGKGSELYDIHSLYLALPMLFGWIGSLCFVFILLYIIFKLRNALTYTSMQHYGIPIGLLIGWLVFLINEFKVNATALPNYFLIVWLLLGLSIGVDRNRVTIRKQVEKFD